MTDIDYLSDIRAMDSKQRTLLESYLLATSHKPLSENSSMTKTHKKPTPQSAKAKKPETPAEAFTRLATGRTNKAIKAIGLIGQLTGSAYESTPEQRNAIVLALEATVQHVKDAFDGRAKASDTFSLPD